MYDQSDEGLAEAKELLISNGWKLQYCKQDTEYWCRPGKTEGISAKFYGNNFTVYSTNGYPFDNDTYYFPSQIYTFLTYGKDSNSFKKAARDFLKRGYGKLRVKEGSNTDIKAVEEFLSDNYDLRINLVTSRLEWKGKNEDVYQDAEDYDISSMHRAIQHNDYNYGYDKLNNLLNSDFVIRYDPLFEYFQSLPEWDGADYIKQLSETVKLRDTGLNDYWHKSLRRFLTAMVGCAIDPDVTNETSIIFYGSQGEGKTKWLNRLVPDQLNPRQYLFVGNIYDDKDSKMNLSSRMIINLDELGSLNRQEIGYLKSLFTLKTISLREPYMRKSKNFIRRASFVGSIDREEFLNDLAGTRRFLTFAISEIDYEHNVDMNNVLAQAYSLFKSGEKFYFDKDEIKEINQNNDEFRVRTLEEELLQMYFEKPKYISAATGMTTTEIANVFAENNSSYKASNASIKKLGEILTLLGYEKKTVKVDGSPRKKWMVQRSNYPLSTFAYQAVVNVNSSN